MFETRDVFIFGFIAAILAVGFCYLLPWTRRNFRLVVIGIATFVGFIGWNLVLSHAKAYGLDVDAPIIALSWQDVGSGVLAYCFTSLALAAYQRAEPAFEVNRASALAGIVAMIFDIFVL